MLLYLKLALPTGTFFLTFIFWYKNLSNELDGSAYENLSLNCSLLKGLLTDPLNFELS